MRKRRRQRVPVMKRGCVVGRGEGGEEEAPITPKCLRWRKTRRRRRQPQHL